MSSSDFERHLTNCILNGVKQCILVVGPHGVGKTHFAEQTIKTIQEKTKTSILVIKHDASTFYSDVASLHGICTQLHMKLRPPEELPRRTAKTSATDYLDHLKYCINYANAQGTTVILLSDHFERFCINEEPSATLNESKMTIRQRQSLIYQLVDMVHQPNVFFVIIGSTHLLNVKEFFEKRVRSRFVFQTIFKMTPANSYSDLISRFSISQPMSCPSIPDVLGLSPPVWLAPFLPQIIEEALSDGHVRSTWEKGLQMGWSSALFSSKFKSAISVLILRANCLLALSKIQLSPENLMTVAEVLDGVHEFCGESSSVYPSAQKSWEEEEEHGDDRFAPERKRVRVLNSATYDDKPQEVDVSDRSAHLNKLLMSAAAAPPFSFDDTLLPELIDVLSSYSNDNIECRRIFSECANIMRTLNNKPIINNESSSNIQESFKATSPESLERRRKLMALKDSMSRGGFSFLGAVARKHLALLTDRKLSIAICPEKLLKMILKKSAAEGYGNELTLEALCGDTETFLGNRKMTVPSRFQLWSDFMRLCEMGVLQLRITGDGMIERPMTVAELKVLPATTSSVWTSGVVVFPYFEDYIAVSCNFDTSLERWVRFNIDEK